MVSARVHRFTAEDNRIWKAGVKLWSYLVKARFVVTGKNGRRNVHKTQTCCRIHDFQHTEAGGEKISWRLLEEKLQSLSFTGKS